MKHTLLSLTIKSLCQLCRVGISFFLFSMMTVFKLFSKGFGGGVAGTIQTSGMELFVNISKRL